MSKKETLAEEKQSLKMKIQETEKVAVKMNKDASAVEAQLEKDQAEVSTSAANLKNARSTDDQLQKDASNIEATNVEIADTGLKNAQAADAKAENELKKADA